MANLVSSILKLLGLQNKFFRETSKAALVFGSKIYGYEEGSLNFLFLVDSIQPTLLTRIVKLGDKETTVMIVDCKTFNSDVSWGFLGDLLSSKLLMPYKPIIGENIFWEYEVKFKRRLIWEALESIVFENPEIASQLLIEPKYFLYNALLKFSRTFPLSTYAFLNALWGDLASKNVELAMKGFHAALNSLADENWVDFSSKYIRVSHALVRKMKNEIRPPPALKLFHKTLSLNVLSLMPSIMKQYIEERRLYLRLHRKMDLKDPALKFRNPYDYVFLETDFGLCSVSEDFDVSDFISKFYPDAEVNVSESKGFLTSVYVVSVKCSGGIRRFIVKKFGDSVGFKWIPIWLWTLGTTRFAILGSSRLAREYTANKILKAHGIKVPKIFHVSLRKKILFEEFIEGTPLSHYVDNAISKGSPNEKELSLVRKVGRLIAKIHSLGLTLGDCKPEHMIVSKENEIFFVDLEQASLGGDKTWDIAEFLYYSGHYLPSIASSKPLISVVKEFVRGYLYGGGKKETVIKAGHPKYAKVFTIITPPQAIEAISEFCLRVGEIL